MLDVCHIYNIMVNTICSVLHSADLDRSASEVQSDLAGHMTGLSELATVEYPVVLRSLHSQLQPHTGPIEQGRYK